MRNILVFHRWLAEINETHLIQLRRNLLRNCQVEGEVAVKGEERNSDQGGGPSYSDLHDELFQASGFSM